MAERNMSRIFTNGDESSVLLVSWWEKLDRDRGERAGLRRASCSTEVVYCPSFHRLLTQLRGRGFPIGTGGAAAIAAVAGIAAHVKTHTAESPVAEQMAKPKSHDGGARVSGLRFRRLLAVSDRDELYPLLVRVVRLLGGSVNLVSLANSVFWWNERTKKDWAYKYYAKAPSEL